MSEAIFPFTLGRLQDERPMTDEEVKVIAAINAQISAYDASGNVLSAHFGPEDSGHVTDLMIDQQEG